MGSTSTNYRVRTGEPGGVFNRWRIRVLAGPRSFERGEDYARTSTRTSTVTKVRFSGTSAEATVRGSAPYNVRLGVEDGEPTFRARVRSA